MDKLIAYSFYGLKEIISYFFSEFSDVYIYGSIPYNDITTPDIIHNFFALEYLTRFWG